MNATCTLDQRNAPAMRRSPPDHAVALFALSALASLLISAAPARAADGCLVLLCFAAPNWHAIPQCVPPVTQVLRDLALGKAFPTCATAGAGNSASNTWSHAPAFCPPQYTHAYSDELRRVFTCDFSGAVSVTVAGALFTRTWWSTQGDSSTEFSPLAKAQLGTWDTRFDDDYAAWLSAEPPAPSGADY